MWLLNTKTFELKEFFGDKERPQYAILSHTWEKEEVSFAEFQEFRNSDVVISGYAQMRSRDPHATFSHYLDYAALKPHRPSIRTPLMEGWSIVDHDPGIESRQGFLKIKESCRTARELYKSEWIWIDTCCIDKRSSAELSEAINSMFRWYQKATRCIAFLVDVDGADTRRQLKAMEKSRWFTRGWTLQELVAPMSISFFTGDWACIGELSGFDPEPTMANVVTKASGIPVERLWTWAKRRLSSFPVGQRMSWVSKRQTTRGEDQAYCLMGLFKVNMPILYGEGARRAFIRLQEEIIKTSSDQTMFAWHGQLKHCKGDSGLFAPFASRFPDTWQMVPVKPKRLEPTVLTNIGLSIWMRLIPADAVRRCPASEASSDSGMRRCNLEDDIGGSPVLDTPVRRVYGALQCAVRDGEEWKIVTVYLERRPNSKVFRRITCTQLFLFPPRAFSGRPEEQILVLEDQQMSGSEAESIETSQLSDVLA